MGFKMHLKCKVCGAKETLIDTVTPEPNSLFNKILTKPIWANATEETLCFYLMCKSCGLRPMVKTQECLDISFEYT